MVDFLFLVVSNAEIHFFFPRPALCVSLSPLGTPSSAGWRGPALVELACGVAVKAFSPEHIFHHELSYVVAVPSAFCELCLIYCCPLPILCPKNLRLYPKRRCLLSSWSQGPVPPLTSDLSHPVAPSLSLEGGTPEMMKASLNFEN